MTCQVRHCDHDPVEDGQHWHRISADELTSLIAQAKADGAREALGVPEAKIVGQCGKCSRPMVSRIDWAKLSDVERLGRNQHEAGGICRMCYTRIRRAGGKVPTKRYLIENLLEDTVDLRSQGLSSRRELASRLGISLHTFEAALYRAKKKGDARAAKILEEVRR